MVASQFYPTLSNIIDITNAQKAVVTFDADHDFTDGEILSLRTSRPYGMYEVNQKSARVLSHTSDTVTLELDTLGLNPFVYPPIGEVIYPSIAVPAGSGIVPGQYTATVNLQDSFDNVPTN
jgi:hypothetical protein